jgi:hypothetical protein
LVHAEASVAAERFVKYFPALQGVHADELAPEYHPLGHCQKKKIIMGQQNWTCIVPALFF